MNNSTTYRAMCVMEGKIHEKRSITMQDCVV